MSLSHPETAFLVCFSLVFLVESCFCFFAEWKKFFFHVSIPSGVFTPEFHLNNRLPEHGSGKFTWTFLVCYCLKLEHFDNKLELESLSRVVCKHWNLHMLPLKLVPRGFLACKYKIIIKRFLFHLFSFEQILFSLQLYCSIFFPFGLLENWPEQFDNKYYEKYRSGVIIFFRIVLHGDPVEYHIPILVQIIVYNCVSIGEYRN